MTFQSIKRWLSRILDFECLNNEVPLLIIIYLIMAVLHTVETRIIPIEVFDLRLHWVPEVFIFFFVARLFRSKMALSLVFIGDWLYVAIHKILRFGDLTLTFPHFYQFLILSAVFTFLGYFSKPYLSTKRFERFNLLTETHRGQEAGGG